MTKIEFNKVTTLSKIIAGVLFVIIPFLAFWLGENYGYELGYLSGIVSTIKPPMKITGGLTYPSENMPILKVCAQNIDTSTEYCVTTSVDLFNFEIDVVPGKYIVYAATDYGHKAYYTKCDTYEDSFIPECNPNAGPESDNGKWNDADFQCFNDPVCKAAFTPLVIEVTSAQDARLKKIQQGWYLPCSYTTEVCWKDYLN
jgi:hypothetical protein